MSTPLVEELSPAPDPLESCGRLSGLPYLIFLDSAADPEHLGRYSYLAGDPYAVVRSRGRETEVIDRLRPARRFMSCDALAAVREALSPHAGDPVAGIPAFQGGAAGFLGYDWGAVLERLPRCRFDDLILPDVILPLYDWVVAWDRRERRAWLISNGAPSTGAAGERRAADRLGQAREWLSRGAPVADGLKTSALPSGASPPTFPAPGELAQRTGIRSTFSREGYLAAVERVREYILAGDIFQANLSQRFQARLNEPPFTLYRRLRALNPAPFAAYLDFEGIVVASASPERFQRLDPSTRMVETRPIKGTRPRGTGPMHDAALGQALSESEKDRAENVMIVDLLRNDLSRVCRPGSVRVPDLFALEHHPTVHHLVSTVVGELEPGLGADDLLRATFPGGSITGAPKVRAMEIIAELEPTQRGVYCGSVGYLSATGAMDTSIVIRTYIALGGEVYFQAGGGIVADSNPEAEYEETLDKAQALMRALEARTQDS